MPNLNKYSLEIDNSQLSSHLFQANIVINLSGSCRFLSKSNRFLPVWFVDHANRFLPVRFFIQLLSPRLALPRYIFLGVQICINLLPFLYLVNARCFGFWPVLLQHITIHILCFCYYLGPAQRAWVCLRVDGSLKVAAALIDIILQYYTEAHSFERYAHSAGQCPWRQDCRCMLCRLRSLTLCVGLCSSELCLPLSEIHISVSKVW